jgi:DNA polymerase-4
MPKFLAKVASDLDKPRGFSIIGRAEAVAFDPRDLIDVQSGRRAAAEAAMDKLRDKFGKGAVETGYTFGGKRGQ